MTPEREALAHAIAAHAEAVATASGMARAIHNADQAVYAARDAVGRAEAAVNESRDVLVAHLVVTASGGISAAPRSVREARDALDDAKGALDAARGARDALQGRLPDAQGRVRMKATLLSDAAHAVIASEAAGHAAALGEDVQAVQVEAIRKGAALAWLSKVGALPMVQQSTGRVLADPAMRRAVSWQEQTQRASTLDGWQQAAATAGALAWDEALAALQRDAAAPLPL